MKYTKLGAFLFSSLLMMQAYADVEIVAPQLAHEKYRITLMDEKPFVYEVEENKYLTVESDAKTVNGQPVVMLSIKEDSMMYTINARLVGTKETLTCVRLDRLSGKSLESGVTAQIGEKMNFILGTGCMKDKVVMNADKDRYFLTVERIE